MDQQGGSSAAEPYFQVRGEIEASEDAIPQHGQRGVARFPLTKTPLLKQWDTCAAAVFPERIPTLGA